MSHKGKLEWGAMDTPHPFRVNGYHFTAQPCPSGCLPDKRCTYFTVHSSSILCLGHVIKGGFLIWLACHQTMNPLFTAHKTSVSVLLCQILLGMLTMAFQRAWIILSVGAPVPSLVVLDTSGSPYIPRTDLWQLRIFLLWVWGHSLVIAQVCHHSRQSRSSLQKSLVLQSGMGGLGKSPAPGGEGDREDSLGTEYSPEFKGPHGEICGAIVCLPDGCRQGARPRFEIPELSAEMRWRARPGSLQVENERERRPLGLILPLIFPRG